MNTVEVALKLAIGDYMAKLGVAGQRTKQFGNDLQQAAQAPHKDLKQTGTAALVMGGAIGAGFAIAAHSAMAFDKQMSEVGAVASASSEELAELRQAALDAGAATVFSASEAAQAQAELAKAGVSTADILGGGLSGALDLAAAGSLDLATAAEIAANTMTQFKLDGGDVGHIADLLAAGANKSATDVTEMGMALKQGGAAAANMGIPLEETVGLLAVFAQNALKGSDGGTAMKTMLASLSGTSEATRKKIKEMGLEFFDAQGNFLGLEHAAEELRLKLGPLNDEQRNVALNTIFGTDASRAAIAMMQGGGAAVRQWTADVDKSGYAAQLAAEKNDNLAGDLEQLKGSIETTLIQGGSQATGVLRGLTQGVTDLVNGIGEMPAPLQSAFLGVVALTGAASLAVGVYGVMAPKVWTVINALTEMGPLGLRVAANFGTLVTAAGVAVIALAMLAQMFDSLGDGARKADEFIESVQPEDKSIKAMTDSLNQLRAKHDELLERHKAQRDGILDMGSAFLDTVVPIHNVEDSLTDTKGELDAVGDALDEAEKNAVSFAEVSRGVAEALGITVDEAQKLVAASEVDWNLPFDQAVDGVVAYHDALNAGTPAAQAMTGAVAELGDETKTAEEKLDALSEALDTFIEGELALPRAVDGMRSAINSIADDAKEVREKAGGAFDGTSDAAIRLRGTLGDVVETGADVVTAMKAQGSSAEEIRYALGLLGGAYLDQAEKAGVPKDVAQGYYDLLMGLPDLVPTEIEQPGMEQALTDTATLNGQLAVTGLGAVGIVAVPGADGAITLTNSLNEELGTVGEGATGAVTVTGADGAKYSVWLVNGELNVVKQGATGHVDVDTSEATRKLNDLRALIGITVADGTYGRGLGVLKPAGMAAGGPVSPWSGYIVHDTRHPELLTLNDGTSMLLTGSQGGYVTNLGAANGTQDYLAAAPTQRTAALAAWTGSAGATGSGGVSVLAPITIDARGATRQDARSIEDAVDRAVTRTIPRIKRELDRSDRSGR